MLTLGRVRVETTSEPTPFSNDGENKQEPLVPGSEIGVEATPLTVSRLEDLDKAQSTSIKAAKRQPVVGNNSMAEEQAYKKLAFGTGKSPSSSITTHSQGSVARARAIPAMPALPASHRALSSPTHLIAHDSMDFGSRGTPTSGKRLFNPSDTSTPHHAQQTNLSSSGGNPSILSRPLQQFRNRRSHSQTAAPTSLERPSSSFAPGTLPGEILMGGKSQANQHSLGSEPSKIISQPETRPISQEQLVAEVKGIYAGLVMVEGKCIQVDLKQAQLAKEAQPGTQPKLNNEQYQALIALHRTLLHEHHDFFLASQHPSATPAVRRLAVKYAMPARLWRHGIHSFLELLRNRLPASLDYMLSFIYLAYSMMTLLLETVPAFEDTWIECLGDLGRYRMAIEDDNIRDREVWTQVARQWYLKSANRSPTTGRLYHHLAILARPEALPQLLYYGKSLSVPVPFTAARESIMTLFEPAFNPKSSRRRLSPIIASFVRCHGIIFTGQCPETFNDTSDEFIGYLDLHIARITKKYLEQGYYLAISNCMALLGYGSDDNPLQLLMKSQGTQIQDRDVLMTGTSQGEESKVPIAFENALRLFNQTTLVHLQRIGDTNVLSFIHVTLVFMRHMSQNPSAMRLLAPDFPWASLVTMLNTLLHLHPPADYFTIESPKIPKPETTSSTEISMSDVSISDIAGNHETVTPSADEFRPFPEEWAMQGLAWTADYFPQGWFVNENVEAEKHYMEAESTRTAHRPERVLWLGCQIARSGEWIVYDPSTHTFALPGGLAGSSSDGGLLGNARVAGSECESETLMAEEAGDGADEQGSGRAASAVAESVSDGGTLMASEAGDGTHNQGYGCAATAAELEGAKTAEVLIKNAEPGGEDFEGAEFVSLVRGEEGGNNAC